MSRAFVKESDRDERLGPPPPPLPPGTPNYITPEGAAHLRAERERLAAERARIGADERPEARAEAARLDGRLAHLDSRAATWVPLPAPTRPDRVVFGCRVRYAGEDGVERVVRLVGVDEVDVPAGRVSFLSPLGRALIGAAPGEVVTLETPRGREELEVQGVEG